MSVLPSWRTASLAAVTAAIMIAQQVAASATRDAFFLANFPASALTGAVIASSVLSVAFLPFLARMMARFGPAVVTPLTAAVSALLLMTEWMVSRQHPAPAAAALFLHTMVVGSVLVSGFWSLFNERFDPHTAKQLMGRVAGGAALGGVAGGLLVERAGAAGIELPNLLPALAAVQLLAAAGCGLLGSRPVRSLISTPDSAESFSQLMSSAYLREIALLVGLTAFVSTITSFLLKAEAARTYAHGGELLRFFARYYLALGLVGFLLQINFTRLALNRLGLGITVAILPAALGALGIVAFAAPSLWSLALLRGVDEAVTNSLFRSGYELLYTPIAASTKRRFKAIVDVGFDRFGKTLGSGLVLLVIGLFAATQVRVLLAVTVVATIVAIVIAVRLSRGYVLSLTRSLKSQAVRLDANALDEAITLRTIDTSGLNRNELLAALADRANESTETASLEFAGGEAGMWGAQTMVVRGRHDRGEGSDRAGDSPDADTLLSDIADLRSGDRQRSRKVLQSAAPLDRRLVAHIIPLLSRDDVSYHAVSALRAMADRVAGQLVDTLLDPGVDPVIRRRIPQVLTGSGSATAAAGLLQALDDPEFEVRFRSAGALVRMREAHPDIAMPHDAIYEAALREIRRGRQALEKPPSDGVNARSLELVFRILSLKAEPLRFVHYALRSGDARLHGTALEYVETVLPAQVLQELIPFIRASGPLPHDHERSK